MKTEWVQARDINIGDKIRVREERHFSTIVEKELRKGTAYYDFKLDSGFISWEVGIRYFDMVERQIEMANLENKEKYKLDNIRNPLKEQLEKIGNEQMLLKIAIDAIDKLNLAELETCTLRFARVLEQGLYDIQMKCVELRREIAL